MPRFQLTLRFLLFIVIKFSDFSLLCFNSQKSPIFENVQKQFLHASSFSWRSLELLIILWYSLLGLRLPLLYSSIIHPLCRTQANLAITSSIAPRCQQLIPPLAPFLNTIQPP